jgi:hypothetical protein
MVLIDAPVPGVGPWEEILKNPLLWHFRFGGPDMERLVAGRERIYLDRFWNEFSASPERFSEAARQHYAKLYALPGAMHSGFAQFAAFDQDAIDNREFLASSRLKMPILAVGGQNSFGPMMATVMRAAGDDVTEGIVPDAGHWIMEENPRATIQWDSHLGRAHLEVGTEKFSFYAAPRVGQPTFLAGDVQCAMGKRPPWSRSERPLSGMLIDALQVNSGPSLDSRCARFANLNLSFGFMMPGS